MNIALTWTGWREPARTNFHGVLVSMAAIGMKSHLKEFATVGFRPILLMVSETVFLLILVVGFIFVSR